MSITVPTIICMLVSTAITARGVHGRVTRPQDPSTSARVTTAAEAADVPEVLANPYWVRVNEVAGDSYNYIPAARRSASSAIFKYNAGGRSLAKNSTRESTVAEEEGGEEYMIISGGFSDKDWRSFPVYAFPISQSIHTGSGKWVDLTPPPLDHSEQSRCNLGDRNSDAVAEKLYREASFIQKNATSAPDLWNNASESCPPSGRVGHQTIVYKNYLYVFGGLIYDGEQAHERSRRETFRLEDIPFVYRLDIVDMMNGRLRSINDGRTKKSKQTFKGWQRVIPRVKPYSAPNGVIVSTSAALTLLNSINRGNAQGGLLEKSDDNERAKLIMYGGLRIAQSNFDSPSKFVKGDHAFSGSSTLYHTHKLVQLPLGDIYAYDLELDCYERFTNDYGMAIDVPGQISTEHAHDDSDDGWLLNADYADFPRPRTAHAATVVGNWLVVHGGLGWDEHTNDWDGSTNWETLGDMWIFDLITRKWSERTLLPRLVRSYHSLVGWKSDGGNEFGNMTFQDGPTVAAFGGYTKEEDFFRGEGVAYVFDDLLLSKPSSTSWYKASMDGSESNAISTRYEQTALLCSTSGVLFVWGGSFQDTSHINGLWMINIAGEDSKVGFELAGEDQFFANMASTVSALHTIIIMLMFLSMSLTMLLGMTQRYQELINQANEEAGNNVPSPVFGPVRSNRGLHPQIIGTLPTKTYIADEQEGCSADSSGDDGCCPICLCEFSNGDELRVLPCGHEMHKTCLDAWLITNPTCPKCRYSMADLVDDSPMTQLRSMRFSRSRSAALSRFLGHVDLDSEPGDLELAETSTGTILPVDVGNSSTNRPLREILTAEAMDEVGSGNWRAARRRRQRRRSTRLASLRSNVSRLQSQRRAGSRGGTILPLESLDEDDNQIT